MCVVVLLEVVGCTWKRQKSYRAISSHGGVGSISSARVGATAAQCCDVVDRTGALQVIGDAWLHEVTVWRDVERRRSSNGGRSFGMAAWNIGMAQR
jgi:hypothetical protein